VVPQGASIEQDPRNIFYATNLNMPLSGQDKIMSQTTMGTRYSINADNKNSNHSSKYYNPIVMQYVHNTQMHIPLYNAQQFDNSKTYTNTYSNKMYTSNSGESFKRAANSGIERTPVRPPGYTNFIVDRQSSSAWSQAAELTKSNERTVLLGKT